MGNTRDRQAYAGGTASRLIHYLGKYLQGGL